MGIGLGKLLEGEARHLGDHVVDGRLEGGRGGAAGDLVLQLVEGVAHGQLGRHLGDGKAGGLGGQRRGAGHARIHLDDDHAPVLGIDGELHVGAARVHADLAQHRQGGVAHDLVFLVGQGLGRGHGDGITGVDAHGIQVFDGTNDDAVVLAVPHHFHLVFLPAENGFLDQQLVGGRQVQAAQADLLELLAVVGDAAAGAAHGEGRADDGGEADGGLHLQRLFHAVGNGRARHVQTDAGHGLAETFAILGLVDGVTGGADHFHAVLFEHALAGQIQSAVEGGLPAHGWQQRVRALLLDDPGHHLPGDGFDVGSIGHLGVGHDGGRIGIDQDDPVALLLQRLAGLGAGIVELTGLADDDGAGADDEDALNVGTFGHGFSSCRSGISPPSCIDSVPVAGRRANPAYGVNNLFVGTGRGEGAAPTTLSLVPSSSSLVPVRQVQ